MGKKNYQQSKDKKSFAELGVDVKEKFFKDNFTDLLNMSKVADLNKVLNQIEGFVEQEGGNLSTSQLRNIYDKVIKANTLNEVKLIRPNLAYLAGRSTNTKEKGLFAFINLLIEEISSDQQIMEFKTFFEAVVAYHKFYGKQ